MDTFLHTAGRPKFDGPVQVWPPTSGAQPHIHKETTLTHLERDEGEASLTLSDHTVFVWGPHDTYGPLLPALLHDVDFASGMRACYLQRRLGPTASVVARRDTYLALPVTGAPYRLEKVSGAGLAASGFSRFEVPQHGPNLCLQPLGRKSWRLVAQAGYTALGKRGGPSGASGCWGFEARAAVGDAARLWILDAHNSLHTWGAGDNLAAPHSQFSLAINPDEPLRWAVGGMGQLALAQNQAITLADPDGVRAHVACPLDLAQPTAITFAGLSLLAVGDACGQVAFLHTPTGTWSPATQLGCISGHTYSAYDRVVALASQSSHCIYALQQSGLLRRLQISFSPSENGAPDA